MIEFINEQISNFSTLSEPQYKSVVFMCGFSFILCTSLNAIIDFFGERTLRRWEKRKKLSSDKDE